MEHTAQTAFRAQLVDPGQRQLYDYWHGLIKKGQLPTRADICPKGFSNLLPKISLIDVVQARFKVRLAGTGYREMYHEEITGKYLDEFEWGEKVNYWMASYARVVEDKAPANGVLSCPLQDKEHILQYWLRLPLGGESGNVSMILSYDHFTNVEDVLLVPQYAAQG